MVYLLHFDAPLSGRANHYIGWTQDQDTLPKRLKHHATGTSGVCIMRAVHAQKITFRLARLWQGGDKHFERKLKNRHEAPRLCPICNPDTWNKLAPENTQE